MYSGTTLDASREILERLRASDYCGFDPYDGLNSTISHYFSSTQFAQRLLTQVVKLFPLHMQPLLGVPQSVSATTLGYSLAALARLHRRDSISEIGPIAGDLHRRLLHAALLGSPTELAWGSHSDVTTRFGHTSRHTPNVVVTSCAAQGLLEATTAGILDGREELKRVLSHFRRRLTRHDSQGRLWFAYTPETSVLIHNGSALAIRVLDGCARILEDVAALQEASQALATLVDYQRPDGSWPYAEGNVGRWVDGLHTGFILETLGRRVTIDPTDACIAALRRGGGFYVRRLFGPNGEPRYSVRSTFPLDVMAAAQALEVLPLLVGHVDGVKPLASRVESWVRQRLLLRHGRVAYQVHRHWTDRRQFPRWSLAPMAAALAGLHVQCPEQETVVQ